MAQEAGRLEVEPSRQRALAHRQQGGGKNYGGQRRGEVQPPGPEGVKKREREGRDGRVAAAGAPKAKRMATEKPAGFGRGGQPPSRDEKPNLVRRRSSGG